MPRAQIALLPDGRRLHLQDGPIDLVIEAWGAASAIETAYRAAAARFVTILDELCTELPLLRSAAQPYDCRLTGIVARRMHVAVAPFADRIFITPMAAVAGAVAEEILGAMKAATHLSRAYVNNGGDIALHLAAGETFKIAMIDRPDCPSLFGTASIAAEDTVRGIATSGWRGRSFSLGIADAVTVMAPTASMADAAATVIANAVDLPGHPGILRVPATDLQPDSDLGARLVTRHVSPLVPADIVKALDAGEATALSLLRRKLIATAALHLRGQTRLVGIETDRIARPSLDHPTSQKAIAHA
jgi:ApbE superfamily uncharacterized protein (UPF0280 family)